MTYLDNSATTALAPEVRDAMQPYLEGEFGNASSVHTLGSRARVALEEARETIARAIHAEPREIVFTSGGTESNNAALKGVLFKKVMDSVSWSELSLLTSRAEHHAILEPSKFLHRLGAHIEYCDVDTYGHCMLTPSSVSGRLTLASIMMVNNETGAINSIRTMGEAIKAASPALLHTDAVQALGKLKIDVQELGVDLLSISAHKIHGPKGIGALYIKAGTPFEPLIYGGSQERNRRGGTEAVALAVGFAEAVRRAAGHETDFAPMRSYLLDQLGTIPEVILNSATDSSSIDSIVNFSFIPEVLARLDVDALIIRFDLEGIAVSNGSACTSGSLQPSHVLLACGKGDEVASKSVRVSFSRYTTRADIDTFIAALRRILPAT